MGRRWWSGHRALGFGVTTAGGDVLLGAVKGEKGRDETVVRRLESGEERVAGGVAAIGDEHNWAFELSFGTCQIFKGSAGRMAREKLQLRCESFRRWA